MTILRRLRVLWRALDLVRWRCQYCATTNETSAILWPTVKTRLTCDRCGNMQNYPDYIKQFDPTPTPREKDAA